MVRACAGAMPVHTGRCWLLLVKRVWKYVKPSKGRRLCDATCLRRAWSRRAHKPCR